MRNTHEVHDADQDERDIKRVSPRRFAKGTIRRPLRFSDLEAAGERITEIREMTAPRESWLGLEPEY